MKRKKMLISLVCIMFLSVLTSMLYLSNNKSFKILVENSKCSQKKYYFNHKNKDIYIDCLESISIKKKGKTYDLKDAVNRNIVSFEEILKSADDKFEYWDGGSVLYKYKDFSIVVYQRRLKDNKQCNYIVISNKNVNINDYCCEHNKC